MCYKCSNYSSHLRGNQCPSCQQNYIFSFVSFGKSLFSIECFEFISQFFLLNFTEILPLVEFFPDSDIPDHEVERLLMAPPKPDSTTIDPFVDTIVNEEASDILPLCLDRNGLRAMEPTTVLIARWPPPLKTKYYRNLLPELQISICPECLQVRRCITELCLSVSLENDFSNMLLISTGIPLRRL